MAHSKCSSWIVWPLLIVINSVPQIGLTLVHILPLGQIRSSLCIQGTKKSSTHRLSPFLNAPLKQNSASTQLKDFLVNSSNYIEARILRIIFSLCFGLISWFRLRFICRLRAKMCAIVPDCAELCGFVSTVIVGADSFPKFFLYFLGLFFEAELNFFAGSARICKILQENARICKKT